MTNAASNAGDRSSFSTGLFPAATFEKERAAESPITLVPPNTIANPGAVHPGVAVALEHDSEPNRSPKNSRAVPPAPSNPDGTNRTGTASWAGRRSICADVVTGFDPLLGDRARTGALEFEAALRAHHGPAANASAHPLPAFDADPPLDAAAHTFEPAKSEPLDVSNQPPKTSAIFVLVA